MLSTVLADVERAINKTELYFVLDFFLAGLVSRVWVKNE